MAKVTRASARSACAVCGHAPATHSRRSFGRHLCRSCGCRGFAPKAGATVKLPGGYTIARG